MIESTKSDRTAAGNALPGGEKPIPFRQIPELIEREYGHRPHLASVHRWRMRGVNGVLLPSHLIGARRFVRPADVREFMVRVNAKAASPSAA